MANYFDVLGIPQNASIEVAQVAYRKLAMQHHPDRGGSEAQFKLIKEAWEAIEGGYRAPTSPAQSSFNFVPKRPYAPPEDPAGAWRTRNYEDLYKKPTTKSAYQPPKPKFEVPRPIKAYRPPRVNKGDFVAYVSMRDAFNGFICEIDIEGKTHRINVPKGAPDGLRFTAPIKDLEDVTIIVRFNQSQYSFVSLDNAKVDKIVIDGEIHVVHRTADLKITLELSKQELKKTQTLTDILGKEFTVKHPDFYNPNGTPEIIKVEKRGYVDWCSSKKQAGENRGNIYVTIVPLEKNDATMFNF